jgi:hypothetical protein
MAKGFAVVFMLLVTLSACSKKSSERDPNGQITVPEGYPLSSSKLENCRFKDPAPTYSFNSTIELNAIQCDDGVPRTVQVLTPNGLPNGLEFTYSPLGLHGTAKERVVAAPYEFYLENEAGYQIIRMTITIK